MCAANDLKFSQNMEMLKDEKLWVFDTAATVHSMPHQKGMTNLRKPGANEHMTMGNGANEKASVIGEVAGTKYDWYGIKEGQAKLKEVRHMLTGVFNLFSGMAGLKDGWTIKGNNKAITISQGTTKVVLTL